MSGLLDAAFETSLQSLPDNRGQQALDFVKNVLKGVLYAELAVASRNVTGQIKNGDGSNHTAQVDVLIHTAAPAAISPNPQIEGTVTVTTGTSSAAGTFATHVKTNASGIFAFSVGGVGAVGVEVAVNKGLTTISVVS